MFLNYITSVDRYVFRLLNCDSGEYTPGKEPRKKKEEKRPA